MDVGNKVRHSLKDVLEKFWGSCVHSKSIVDVSSIEPEKGGKFFVKVVEVNVCALHGAVGAHSDAVELMVDASGLVEVVVLAYECQDSV